MSETLSSGQPKAPVKKILDSAIAVALVARGPSAVQVSAVPGATTVEIQAKLDADGAWVTLIALTSANAAAGYIQTFPVRYNFVQVVRTVGVGDIVAYAQQ